MSRPVSIWCTEAEQAAQQIGLHCIDQRADGGYWFHHAKAVATINHYMKQRTFISDERLKMCLMALMTVQAAISKSPRSVDFQFTIARIIDNCLEACADDVSRFTANNLESTKAPRNGGMDKPLVANRCPRCQGCGKVLYGDEEDVCGTCNGSGINSKGEADAH